MILKFTGETETWSSTGQKLGGGGEKGRLGLLTVALNHEIREWLLQPRDCTICSCLYIKVEYGQQNLHLFAKNIPEI